jgi:hypothetical protein
MSKYAKMGGINVVDNLFSQYDMQDANGNPVLPTDPRFMQAKQFIAQHGEIPPIFKPENAPNIMPGDIILKPKDTTDNSKNLYTATQEADGSTTYADAQGNKLPNGLPQGVSKQQVQFLTSPDIKQEEQQNRTIQRKQDPYQFKINRIKALGDDLDADKQANNPYGIAQKGYDRAQRLSALISRYPDGNLDQRETSELAIGLNAILSGNNFSAQSQVAGLVPKSIIGNAMKLNEWITNNPQGLQQQQFVKRMKSDVDRESDTMYNQLLEKGSKKLAKYNDVLNNMSGLSPDEQQDITQQFNDVVASRGIDMKDYNAWEKSGFKKKSVIPQNLNNQSSQQNQGQGSVIPQNLNNQSSQQNQGQGSKLTPEQRAAIIQQLQGK